MSRTSTKKMKVNDIPLTASDILVLLNGWSFNGISGGDRHLLDMIFGWSDIGGSPVQVILPELGRQVIGDYLSKMSPYIMRSVFDKRPSSHTLDLVITYAWRIVVSSFANLIHPPRIVIASSHLPYDVWPAFILSRRYKSKLVVYIYHLIQEQNRAWSLRNVISRISELLSLPLIQKYADLVITDNQIVSTQLSKMGFVQDRLVVSHLGISLKNIQSAARQANNHQVVVLSRLVRNKGIFDLPDIWAKITSILPESKLLIMGDGPERVNLIECFKTAGIDSNVEFAGFIDGQNKYSLLKGCKLFLAPSHEEGWGIAVCEAMACSLPVVAYDLPAYRSVFRQGILRVPIGDNAGLADYVIKLLQNEELRQETGRAAYQQALEYDVTVIAQQQWNWLRELFS